MKKCICTSINKDSWQQGLQWVRNVKQFQVPLLVIDMGLEEDHIDKLKELNVQVVTNCKKTVVDQVDVFNTLAKHADDDVSYLFWDVSVRCQDISPLWSVTMFGASPGPAVNLFGIVFPLTSIENRVSIGNRLEENLKKYNGRPFSAKIICGTGQYWKFFAGIYSAFVEIGFIEATSPASNLVLNLFAMYFPENFEVREVEFALQPASLG